MQFNFEKRIESAQKSAPFDKRVGGLSSDGSRHDPENESTEATFQDFLQMIKDGQVRPNSDGNWPAVD